MALRTPFSKWLSTHSAATSSWKSWSDLVRLPQNGERSWTLGSYSMQPWWWIWWLRRGWFPSSLLQLEQMLQMFWTFPFCEWCAAWQSNAECRATPSMLSMIQCSCGSCDSWGMVKLLRLSRISRQNRSVWCSLKLQGSQKIQKMSKDHTIYNIGWIWMNWMSLAAVLRLAPVLHLWEGLSAQCQSWS